MRDYDDRNEGRGDGGESILIAQVGTSFWLLDGEVHLDEMLSGPGGYPTPVQCLELPSLFELAALLPEGMPHSALWGIHPAVVERLKRHDELIFVALPDAD